MAFHDVQFPPKISRGASGGPKLNTAVAGSASGFEQRNQNWAKARRSYSVGRFLKEYSEIQDAIAFFMAREGRTHSFRFKDWADYFAGMEWSQANGLTHGPAPYEIIGTGDGIEDTFQLTKAYSSGAQTVSRDITKPVSGSVKIWLDEVEQVSGWTLNYLTGILTFTSPPAGSVVVAWSGEFDVPVRFDSDELPMSLGAIDVGEWPSIQLIEVRGE
jgi:uncharacterized protein (TIGR02217 family)